MPPVSIALIPKNGILSPNARLRSLLFATYSVCSEILEGYPGPDDKKNIAERICIPRFSLYLCNTGFLSLLSKKHMIQNFLHTAWWWHVTQSSVNSPAMYIMKK